MALVFAAMGTAARADDSAVERTSLTGLSEMSIVVEDLSTAAQHDGLTMSALQDLVAQRVRPAGIAIRPDADAYLYVQVTVADPGGTLPVAYAVNVSLMQVVTLPRGIQTRVPLQSPTWWLTSVGLASRDRVPGGVSDRVGEFVDRFVQAYKSVNTK